MYAHYVVKVTVFASECSEKFVLIPYRLSNLDQLFALLPTTREYDSNNLSHALKFYSKFVI